MKVNIKMGKTIYYLYLNFIQRSWILISELYPKKLYPDI